MSAEPSGAPSALASRRPRASKSAASRKAKAKKPAAGAKKSRGWGPFHSVLKERSVDFNLTLDVQHLQQQVRDLSTLRDILSTRTMLRRHSPEGSLFHVVKEYLRVFRAGWAVPESGRKRLLDEQDQRAFLHSVMDPELDVGNGLRGPDVMAEQIILYSTFIRFIRVAMTSYDIVVAEDSVVIKTQAKLRFQVLRNTIEMIFPHVIGDECLVAQLVGQEVEPSVGITFSFNAEGKCCRYELDVDFVEAFAGIVKDPRKLDMLLARALIADNCMFGLIDEPLPEKTFSATNTANALADERTRLVTELDELQNLTDVDDRSPSFQPSKPRLDRVDAAFQRVVNDYFLVFAKGYRQHGNQKHERVAGYNQDDFISQVFVPERAADPQTGSQNVLGRWQALCESFDVLDFQPTSALPVDYYGQEGMCTIRSTASYALRITPRSIEWVFPHILADRILVTALVGKVLVVPSQLQFTIEMDSGRIYCLVERMDFIEPMAMLLQNQDDLSFVMSQALLSPDGVACYRPQPGRASLPPLVHHQETWENANVDPAPKKRASNTRSMTMADILHS
ncbi:unnamed protein product [Phytophthora lilii]|uniref:Unnamed protein product n=1 Tax=Phytophthora lilii TaxID=2077276 RepID=A0A9W6TIJ3_9STRA|nr:unnamed protein product [Phytophthora lilii]